MCTCLYGSSARASIGTQLSHFKHFISVRGLVCLGEALLPVKGLLQQEAARQSRGNLPGLRAGKTPRKLRKGAVNKTLAVGTWSLSPPLQRTIST